MGLPFLEPKPREKEYPNTDQERIRKLNLNLSGENTYARLLESKYGEVVWEIGPGIILTRTHEGIMREYNLIHQDETKDRWAVLQCAGTYGKYREETAWSVVLAQSEQVELNDYLREMIDHDCLTVSESYWQCEGECEKYVDTQDAVLQFAIWDGGGIMCFDCHLEREGPSCGCASCDNVDWTDDDYIDERERELVKNANAQA